MIFKNTMRSPLVHRCRTSRRGSCDTRLDCDVIMSPWQFTVPDDTWHISFHNFSSLSVSLWIRTCCMVIWLPVAQRGGNVCSIERQICMSTQTGDIWSLCRVKQARSELRFWRGAEVDKVQNPKQLYVINLAKVRKMVSFWQRLKTWSFFRCAAGKIYNFCEIFGALD